LDNLRGFRHGVARLAAAAGNGALGVFNPISIPAGIEVIVAIA
jgi:hypothetical protein